MAISIASGVAVEGLKSVMHLSRRRWYCQLLVSSVITNGVMPFLVVCFLGLTFSDSRAKAQITPDTTLGAESSVVTPQAPNSSVDVIQGGATIGTNLFHSFEQFSVPNGGTAYFNNALNIQNIFSRVTGASISTIDGLIQTNGTANLFLLNPNGIIFGRNASLNIGGSFLGSTATSINFADGRQFSATGNPTTQLLTVSVPIGLQFGGTAGSILNQSRTTNSSGQRAGLQVLPGKTLSLVGGDVRLDGGRLEAPGGRVELGGVAGAGTVGLVVDSNNLLVSFPNGVAQADVYLTNSGSNTTARINVAASNSGSIAINARNIEISGGSSLNAGLGRGLGFPGAQAGDIELRAQEAINITNSFIFNNVGVDAVGNSGSINIMTGSLFVSDGAQLQSLTRGQGHTGSVNIKARDTVSFDGVGSSGFSSLAASAVEAGAVGNAGSINITTGSLSVNNGAGLAATTAGTGNAGNLNINVHDTASFDGGLASSAVLKRAVGNSGSIDIRSGSLSVTNGAQLDARTFGIGNAGNVTIFARDTVSFDGVSNNGLYPSGAISIAELGAVGIGGDINITTGRLIVQDGARVVTSSFDAGKAGDLTVVASETVQLRGTSLDVDGSSRTPSGLFTRSYGTGDSGNLRIETGKLIVQDGARATSSTNNGQQGGNFTVTAKEAVEVTGIAANGQFSSGLFAQTVGAGSAGELKISTGQLNVRDQAEVAVSSEGAGDAGNLVVTARSIHLENLASLSAKTTAGQGNIILDSQNLVLRHGSSITTDAQGTATGGNITLDTDILVASENSDISADAGEAFGGRVRIDAQGIFGTEFRNQPTSESDITASSDLGPQFSGIVEINTPDVDPSQGLATLPTELVDASGLIAQTCPAGEGQGQSEFIVTGRGGLPPNPNEALSSEPVQVDWVTLNPRVETAKSPAQATQPTASFVEAQGWVTNAKGEVILIASHTDTLHSSWQTPTSCRMPKSSLGQ